MYTAAYFIFVLHRCQQVLHVFSVQKMIMIDFFLFGHDSLLSYRIAHIYVLWGHKNKCHCALFPCVGCSF